MGTHKTLFKTIVETSPQAVAKQLQHYTRLGYYIQGGGQVHSHNKLKSIFPFRMEVEYTVFMEKTVSQLEEIMEDNSRPADQSPAPDKLHWENTDDHD